MSSSGLHNQKRTKTTEDELRIKIEKDEKLIKEYSQICNEMYTKVNSNLMLEKVKGLFKRRIAVDYSHFN
jgi:hypothetical protein